MRSSVKCDTCLKIFKVKYGDRHWKKQCDKCYKKNQYNQYMLDDSDEEYDYTVEIPCGDIINYKADGIIVAPDVTCQYCQNNMEMDCDIPLDWRKGDPPAKPVFSYWCSCKNP